MLVVIIYLSVSKDKKDIFFKYKQLSFLHDNIEYFNNKYNSMVTCVFYSFTKPKILRDIFSFGSQVQRGVTVSRRVLQVQSNFNGSNTFGTMKICSR